MKYSKFVKTDLNLFARSSFIALFYKKFHNRIYFQSITNFSLFCQSLKQLNNRIIVAFILSAFIINFTGCFILGGSDDAYISVHPSQIVIDQGDTQTVIVDVKDLDENEGFTGYSIDMGEELTKINIWTEDCNNEKGSSFCETWHITPSLDTVPTTYRIKIEAIGNTADIGSDTLTVIVRPPGGYTPTYPAISIAAGYYHSLAVLTDGSVWGWGGGSNGQLGFCMAEVNEDVSIPVEIISSQNGLSVAAGSGHSLALMNDRKVWAWGLNKNGQLGIDRAEEICNCPTEVCGGVRKIVAGKNHSVALLTDGTARIWGEKVDYYNGILCVQVYWTDRRSPVEIPHLNGVVRDIAAGDGFSLFLMDNGTVWVWGYKDNCHIKYDAVQYTEYCDSAYYTPKQIQNLTSVSDIAAGGSIGLFLMSDGTVMEWRRDANPPSQIQGLNNVRAISTKGNHSLAIIEQNQNNTVWEWDEGMPEQIQDLEGIQAIAAGKNHSLALMTNCVSGGSLKAWGSDTYGQLGKGPQAESNTINNVIGIAELGNCSGTVSFYTIGGDVTGLSGSLQINNNNNDYLYIIEDGLFYFEELLSDGDVYDVSISSQPVGQICVVYEGEGTIINADVSDIEIICTNIPSAPQDVQASAGDGQVTINWDNVDDADSYNIYWDITDDVDIASATKIVDVTSGFVHSPLVNGTAYYYIVTAENTAEESVPSDEVSATPVSSILIPDPPSAPQGVNALAGDGQVTINWDDVDDADSYNIYWDITDDVNIASADKIIDVTSDFVHSPLINGTTYFYIITAENVTGESVPSDIVSATPVSSVSIPSIPDAPQNANASAGYEQITISWNNVNNADSYNIYWSTSSGVTIGSGTKINNVSFNYVHTSLPYNTTYYYIVTAVNSAGESIPSNEASATTFNNIVKPPKPSIPDAPQNINASPGDEQVTIIWDDVDDADSYNIYWDLTDDVNIASATKIDNVTSGFVHSPLINGTIYYYIITARNSAGESTPSAKVSAIPFSSITPPDAPQDPNAIAGNQQVTISWTGVDNADSYNIYWDITDDVNIASADKIADVTSDFVHSPLINDTTYYYIITAENAGGESTPSTEVSATPFSIISLPDAPQDPNAFAGDAQVTISWIGTDNADSYNIYWDITDDVDIASANKIVDVTSDFVHSPLTNDSTYYYIITAENEAGESAPSIEISATPTAPVVDPLNACFAVFPDPPTLNDSDDIWCAACSIGTGLRYRWVFSVVEKGPGWDMCFGAGASSDGSQDTPCNDFDPSDPNDYSPDLQTIRFPLEGEPGYTRRTTLYIIDSQGSTDSIFQEYFL